MTGERGNSNQWEPCAGGEIAGMLRGIQQRKRRVLTLQLAGGALAAVLFGVTFVEFGPAGNVHTGRMTCRDCRKAAKEYIAGRVSADEKRRIAAHLDECPHCAEWMRTMRNKSGGGSRIETPSPLTVSHEPATTKPRSLAVTAPFE